MKIKSLFLTGILLLFCFVVQSKTIVKKEAAAWRLYVDNKSFDIKGVTFGGDWDKNNIGKKMKDLKFLGVNTIRIWGTNDNTQILLDTANAYGIKVMMGIWMRHGRPGMEGDDSFNYLVDTKGMDDMYKGALETVNKFKNHPGVLFWGVGNEVYLNIATDEEKKAYSVFLEKVCSDIKKADTEHPIVSVEAWTFGLKWWKELVPSVDIYGINAYGAGASMLPGEFQKAGVDKPYVITEFGVSGEWDSKKDKNGYLIEPDDQQKYHAIATGYKEWIKSKPTCLGVYVFHYEHGDNFGAVWMLFYFKDSYRPAYWATREAFTGKKPVNNIPSIKEFILPDSAQTPGTWIPVKFKASDIENDKLEISFHYNQRTGSRKRRDQIVPLEFRESIAGSYEIKLPEENGAIKIYAFVKDTYNNLGIAQTSFKVNGKNEGLTPGAKTTIPFYVYQDNKDVPYIPSAYMGDFKDMTLDMSAKDQVHSGETSIKISYNAMSGWFGIGFVDPADDWGDKPGGYNVSGAKKFTFWAKGSSGNVSGKFGYGMIDKGKKYYDSDKRNMPIYLTTEWKKYEIKIPEGTDLRCIRSGFVLYSQGNDEKFSIWIDDIQFE